MEKAYFAGLDLGLAGEFTAFALLERTTQTSASSSTGAAWHYAIRHLERFSLGTPHAEVLAWLAVRVVEPPLAGMTLVIDQTSVGRPIVNFFRRAELPVVIRRVVITGGQQADFHEGCHGVPKRELASALQLVLQERRIKIADKLAHAQTLFQELLAFRPKTRALSDDSAEAWREREHDDLVLSVAIAVWMAERTPAYVPRSELAMNTLESLWNNDAAWDMLV